MTPAQEKLKALIDNNRGRVVLDKGTMSLGGKHILRIQNHTDGFTALVEDYDSGCLDLISVPMDKVTDAFVSRVESNMS